MPNLLNPLTEKQVDKIVRNSKNALLGIGGVEGLCIRVRGSKATFVLRYKLDGLSHQLVLGDWKILSLQQAREIAMEKKVQILKGIDPITVKKQKLSQTRKKQRNPVNRTFKYVANAFIAEREKNGYWKYNSKNGALQSQRLLARYAIPIIGEKSVDRINTETIYSLIAPIWASKTNTAQKLLTLLKQILNWAIAHDIRKKKDNPADLRSSLGVLLAPMKYARRPKRNHAAASISDIPVLFSKLHVLHSQSAKAVEFTILTAARSAAVRLATWDEFDLKKGIWEIPLEHDKSKLENRNRLIYLSKPAIELLSNLYRFSETSLVFNGYHNRPLSDTSLLMVLRRLHQEKKLEDGIGFIDQTKSKQLGKECIITVHGTARATFKTWAKDDELGNNRKFDQEAVELCLLHSRKDAYRGAYDRSALPLERKLIMDEWGKFCMSKIESQ